jgi:hypothetical protein
MASNRQIWVPSERWNRSVEKGITSSADHPQSSMAAAASQMPSHTTPGPLAVSIRSVWTPKGFTSIR